MTPEYHTPIREYATPKRRANVGGIALAVLIVAAALFMVMLWWGSTKPSGVSVTTETPASAPETPAAVPSSAAPPSPLRADANPPVPSTGEPIADLRARVLTVPVQGIARESLTESFDDARGERKHEGIDILAARSTPVLAVEDGVIAKLFESVPGGTTIYQFDPASHYCYYYAHLERYADGLTEGMHVTRGQVIGYVGTTGNAPKQTPHLHFEISKLNDAKQWWNGSPIDPFPVLK